MSNYSLIETRGATYFKNIFPFRNKVLNPIQSNLSSNHSLVESEVPCDSKKRKMSNSDHRPS